MTDEQLAAFYASLYQNHAATLKQQRKKKTNTNKKAYTFSNWLSDWFWYLFIKLIIALLLFGSGFVIGQSYPGILH